MSQKNIPQVPDQPEFYDWMYHKTDKDIAMYLTLTEGHAEILECAVGTGRLAIPLAQSGRIVHGVDYSEAMLNKCRANLQAQSVKVKNNIQLYQGDMRDFRLDKKFSFVFIPFASIVYLLTIEEQQACLLTLKEHLADGGTLVIDYPTWAEATDEHWLTNDSLLRKEKQMHHPQTGKLIEMWTQNRFDASTQILEQDRHFRTYAENGDLEGEKMVLWRSRIFATGEFRLLLETCGLKIEKLYGDFNFGDYNHHSEVAVAVIKPIA